MCVFLFFCLLLAGFSSAFRTNPFENPEDGSTLTHGRITRAGLWLSVIDFLIDNPDYVDENSVGEANLTSIDEVVRELKKGKVDDRLSSLVASPKFSEAVQEIEEANVLVESLEMSLAASHFYNEKLVDGSRRLLILKKRVIWLMQMKESNYEQARKEAGRYLHTLQDFYSNSNWVEFENVSPMEDLGDKIIGKSSVAGTEQETCRSCTPVDNLRDRSPVKDCYGNLIYWTEKLTSGYRYDKPGNARKCSHGGAYDDTRMIPSTGGINKESSSRSLSPHF